MFYLILLLLRKKKRKAQYWKDTSLLQFVKSSSPLNIFQNQSTFSVILLITSGISVYDAHYKWSVIIWRIPFPKQGLPHSVSDNFVTLDIEQWSGRAEYAA